MKKRGRRPSRWRGIIAEMKQVLKAVDAEMLSEQLNRDPLEYLD